MKKKKYRRYLVIGIILVFVGTIVTPVVNSNLQTSQVQQRPVAEKGPVDAVAYWGFNEGIGGIVHDTSGSVNDDGTIYGAEWTDGKMGKALDFDGELDDHVLVPDSNDLDLTEDFTIEFWFYPRAMGRVDDQGGQYYNQQDLICKHKAFVNGDGSWTIETAGPGKKINFDYQATHGFTTNLDFVNNTWYHIACTFNDTNNNFSIYVNGTLDRYGVRDMHYKDIDLDLYIGIEHYNPVVNPYDGLLDEIVLYKRVLEPDEFWGLQENQGPTVEILNPKEGYFHFSGIPLIPTFFNLLADTISLGGFRLRPVIINATDDIDESKDLFVNVYLDGEYQGNASYCCDWRKHEWFWTGWAFGNYILKITAEDSHGAIGSVEMKVLNFCLLP